MFSRPRGVPLNFVGYNLDALRKGLPEIERKFQNHITPSLESVLNLLNTQLAIDTKTPPPQVAPFLLDKNTVASYRTLLYDKEKGLLKTSREQKSFFVSVLFHLNSDGNEKGRLIDKYGQSMFSCSLCCRQTEMVDRSMMLAFCDAECRTLYKNKNKIW